MEAAGAELELAVLAVLDVSRVLLVTVESTVDSGAELVTVELVAVLEELLTRVELLWSETLLEALALLSGQYVVSTVVTPPTTVVTVVTLAEALVEAVDVAVLEVLVLEALALELDELSGQIVVTTVAVLSIVVVYDVSWNAAAPPLELTTASDETGPCVVATVTWPEMVVGLDETVSLVVHVEHLPAEHDVTVSVTVAAVVGVAAADSGQVRVQFGNDGLVAGDGGRVAGHDFLGGPCRAVARGARGARQNSARVVSCGAGDGRRRGRPGQGFVPRDHGHVPRDGGGVRAHKLGCRHRGALAAVVAVGVGSCNGDVVIFGDADAVCVSHRRR
ncbi:hypothetical protein OGATHE_003978 [Ogataea polymorpha]|uniref:Uncharacterized protein n=1 Tax=Ogataea polymorpha TaxID=460523 RepID=A0A9P8T3R1_9ASCO|nr:hypothetical protein OGATHE_003978 [Ogataea polymorpha]